MRGTQAYELGNPNFRNEKSWGVEATLHAHGDGFSFDASAYHSWFTNYIYGEPGRAGGVRGRGGAVGARRRPALLPVSRRPMRAITGSRRDASLRLAKIGGYAINADLLGDYVHATVTGRGPVPRIPPARVLGGIEAQGDRLTARAEVEHAFDQDRIAAFETPTDGYTLVNASLSLKPFGPRRSVAAAERQQHLRRDRAPPRELAEGLRAACRTRPPRDAAAEALAHVSRYAPNEGARDVA